MCINLKNFTYVFCFLAAAGCAFAQDAGLSSSELVSKAWEAHGKRDVESTTKLTQQVIDTFKAEADRIRSTLKDFPTNKSEIEAATVLNDVAVAYFIQAEMQLRQNNLEEAKKLFKLIIDTYPFAQAWDQRGWYWKIAEAARQSIKKIEEGSIEVAQKKKVSQLVTSISLYDPGSEEFVDYARYGEFKNIGTEQYSYIVKDQEGLSAAVGEGIVPNTTSVRWDPAFKQVSKEKRLEGSQWDFLQSPDQQAAFFKWATASGPPGVRLFYTGLILEKAGLIKHAIKCYYAVVVHYPASYGWTYWHTPWYIGQAAIAKINFLLRRNPQIGYKLADADIQIINGYDNDVGNDKAVVNPGHFVKVGLMEKFKPKPNLEFMTVRRRVGKGNVHLLQYETGDWQLIVNDKPFVIKAVTYAATRVGQSPDEGTLGNWMEEDFNKNGLIDGPYEAFVDANRNNKQDPEEKPAGDFALMKEMGVNTIRLYHHPLKVNKELLRDMYAKQGIMVIMGDFLGKYALGSGAKWNPGTDYKNEEHKKNMLESVRQMVMEFKDEPYILFWLLGNENVYGYACNADKEPEAFFAFASEAARMIKEIDPNHPVAICSGDILFLDRFGKYATDVDIFGTNAYRGNYGFGSLWKQVRQEADKPVFITEFGCPAYAEGKSEDEGEELQADYHKGSWEDIQLNTAFSQGCGNALGGVVFEWLDEWWKGYEPAIHDKKSLWPGPFPDGFMHEEWLGLCGQGDGSLSPFLRQLRKSYYTYKKLWK